MRRNDGLGFRDMYSFRGVYGGFNAAMKNIKGARYVGHETSFFASIPQVLSWICFVAYIDVR